MAFVTFNPATQAPDALVTSILQNTSGMSLVGGSAMLSYSTPAGETSSVSFYDGALTALGVGAGLLLSTGDPTPATSNTTPGVRGSDMQPATDWDLLNVISAAYDGADAASGAGPDGVYDVTALSFTVNITDPSIAGVALDFVYGSEEVFAGYDGLFPDIAGVFVNGVDYALFHDDPSQPVGALLRNAGKFVDNSGNALPIEYNGVTHALQVTAPVHLGQNTIKIAVADTGDSGYDSGLFVSHLRPVAYDGMGIAQAVAVSGTGTVTDTAGDQVYTGDGSANKVVLSSGFDVVDGGAGLDTVTYGYSPAATDLSRLHWDGERLDLASGANASELVNVERVKMAGNYLFALDTQPGDHTWDAYALMQAAFNFTPAASIASRWVADVDAHLSLPGHDLGDVAQDIIQFYAPSATNEQVISTLFQNIVGVAPPQSTVAALAAQVGAGHTYETVGDLYAAAAMLPQNTAEIAGIVGTIEELDSGFFG